MNVTVTMKEKSSQVEGCNHRVISPEYGSLSLGGGAGNTINTGFTIDGFCTYTGSIQFSYTTNSDSVAIIGSNQLAGNPPFPCGKGTVSGSFTLETSNGTPVFIS